jgi:hypothetical protein
MGITGVNEHFEPVFNSVISSLARGLAYGFLFIFITNALFNKDELASV